MKKIYLSLFLTIIMAIVFLAIFKKDIYKDNSVDKKLEIKNNNLLINLPKPSLKGEISFEEAVLKRRSVRSYSDEPLKIEEVSQLLWASQGITDFDYNFRTTPSAGALYPLSIYIVVENVENLDSGIYKYLPESHSVEKIKEGNFRNDIYENSLKQSSIKESSLIIIICADYQITRNKYKEHAEKYVHMESGHVGQNIYLQSVSLNLGVVAVGAFDNQEIKNIINSKEVPIYIFPIGKI